MGQKKSRKELVAEARRRNVYSKKFLGKNAPKATEDDLRKAIRNHKARQRRKQAKKVAQAGLLFGAGAGAGYALNRNKLKKARGAVRIIEVPDHEKIEELQVQLELLRIRAMQDAQRKDRKPPVLPKDPGSYKRGKFRPLPKTPTT